MDAKLGQHHTKNRAKLSVQQRQIERHLLKIQIRNRIQNVNAKKKKIQDAVLISKKLKSN